MSGTWATVAVTGGVFCIGVIWQAGQLAAILRELRDITRDHEKRIRMLEESPRRPAARR